MFTFNEREADDSAALVEQRRLAESYNAAIESRPEAEAARREAEGVVADVWPEREAAPPPGEYERFEALARGLVTVPKEEVEAERIREQEGKRQS